MKRCPKHYWFEYDETQGGCPLCAREERDRGGAAPPESVTPAAAAPILGPPDPIARTAPRPEEEPRLPGDDRPSDELDAAALAGFRRIAEAFPRPEAPGPMTEAPPASAPNPTPGPDPVLEQPARPEPAAAPAPAPTPAPPPYEPVDDEDTRILNQLAQLRANGVFTVVVIGFYAGGKTWFLNRIKHELGQRGFNISPPPARDGDRVVRTFNVEIHHARRLKDDQVRSFALIDIPGERLERLVAKNFGSVRSVIAAMEMCGALIVALPADEVLLSEDIQREARKLGGVDKVLLKRTEGDADLHPIAERARQLVVETGSIEDAVAQEGPRSSELERLRAKVAEAGSDADPNDRFRIGELAKDVEALNALFRVYRLAQADAELSLFTQDLCFMTGMMSKLKADGVPINASYNFAKIDAGEVDVHISSQQYARFTRPTFVALTKADLVSHPDPLLAALIRKSRKPDIGIAFDEDPLDTVRDMRTSLAFMFEQWIGTVKFDFVSAFHEHRDSNKIDYGRAFYGVTAVFDWIDWASGWDGMRRGERGALARARKLRQNRDGHAEPITMDFATRKVARK